MADWTNIPNSSLEPGAPIRSIDGRALRDNAVAIAEGAPGAPRIDGEQGPVVQTGGIQNSAVTTAKINNGAVTQAKVQNYVAGTAFDLATRLAETNELQTSFTDHLGMIVDRFGTVRVSFQHRTSASPQQSIAQVRRNNTTVQEFSTGSTSFQSRSVNVTVAPGDTILIRHRSSGIGGNRSFLQQARISVSVAFAPILTTAGSLLGS